MDSAIELSRDELHLLMDPWYHDFSVLGLRTPQRPGIFGPNQACKQGPVFKFIDNALTLCHGCGASAKGAELFCADGFYANYAIQQGAEEIVGIDANDHDLAKARLITRLLGNQEKIAFLHADVFELPGAYDFGICAGGLYHLSNPQDLLKRLREKIRTALVIQTVYSLTNTSEDYFETPAPHWTWGCRFSYPYLLRTVADCGWIVMNALTNELKGNTHPEDRGSAYLLCMPLVKTCVQTSP